MLKLEKDVELVLRDFLSPLPVVVVDQAPAHQVPVVLDVLHQLLELARLHGEEDDQGRGEEEGGVDPPLDQDQGCLGGDERGCEPMGEKVGKAEGEAEGGDAGDYQVGYHSAQVKVPGTEIRESRKQKKMPRVPFPPDAILVELLNGFLQPPVRSHESQGHCDLGVHCPQGPVLNKVHVTGAFYDKKEVVRCFLPARGNRSDSDGEAP